MENVLGGVDHRCVAVPVGTQIDEKDPVAVNFDHIEGNGTMPPDVAWKCNDAHCCPPERVNASRNNLAVQTGAC